MQNLAQNPGTAAEGLAAERAIKRLKDKLSETPTLNCGIDHEATISGPVMTNIMACRWKDKLFYALCMHCNCIPFLTWEDIRGSHRTSRIFKYYIYGNERNAKLVLSLFKSISDQIDQEIRKNRPALRRHQFDSFRLGIASTIFDKLVPVHLRKCYSTSTQSVKTINQFASEHHVNYSFILLQNPQRYFVNDPASVALGRTEAEKLSLDSLLSKPKS